MGASPPPSGPPVDSSLNAALDRQTRLARRVRSQAHATGPRALFWRVSCAFAIVALLAALSSRNASSFGSGARRGLDGAATLPFGAGSADAGDVGPTWTTQRLLRHFGADVAAQVRFVALDASKPPDEILAEMHDLVATTNGPSSSDANENENAARPFAFDVAQISVAYRADGGDGTFRGGTWRERLASGLGLAPPGVAILSDTAYHRETTTTKDDVLPLAEFLREWSAAIASRGPAVIGAEPGLMVTLVDPRAVVPSLRVLRAAVRRGAIAGPLIVAGEILPGPGGFLPELASVFAKPPPHDDETHRHDQREHFSREKTTRGFPPVPGDTADAARMARESRTYFFDPSDFVKAAAGFLPGAILSLGWSAHGICDDTFDAAKARKAYEDWYASGDPGTFEWDLDEEGGAGDEGGRRRRRRTLSEDDDAPEAEDGSDDAAASGDDAAASGDSASNALPQMRCDEQLSVAAENAAGSPDSAASNAAGAGSPTDSAASNAAPSTVLTTKCRYDLNAAALAREAEASPATDAGYGEATARDMYWVLRDAGWAGDVIFDARACALARGVDPDGDDATPHPYKKLLRQKLGYALGLRGIADERTRAWLSGSLDAAPDASTTFAFAGLRDERGERLGGEDVAPRRKRGKKTSPGEGGEL